MSLQPDSALCRFHHRIKTFTTWTIHLTPTGTVEWTSPTGRIHPVPPDDRPGTPHW